jgi:hypothetical protein
MMLTILVLMFMICGTPLLFLCFPPLHLCFLAKIIFKTMEFLKYKIYQKARRNRPCKGTKFFYLRGKTVKLTSLAFVEFVFVSTIFWAKAC